MKLILPERFYDGRVLLHSGECLSILAAMPENSYDSCVTDPPYHFASIVKRFGAKNAAPAKSGATGVYKRASAGFMGKQWDGGQLAHEPETWAAVLRVLKPGAHLVAFHAPKNWHRLACAIEDAGFEIRDNLLWLFGSGFPKSHDVQKAIDKTNGIEFTARPASGVGFMGPDGPGGYNVTKNQLSRVGETSALEWQGFGTALKPAYEPIILARKPLAGGKTIAGNVMEYGTGALNIDACRVDGNERPLVKSDRRLEHNTYSPGLGGSKAIGSTELGRWPANILHDGSPEVVAGFPDAGGGFGKRGDSPNWGPASKGGGTMETVGFGDSGSAARFFYTAKADADDRIGSKHPTVKPLDLMQWLIKLITPPGGKIIDPFAGTGTTGEAALGLGGFHCTLIEREAESIADIRTRMKYACTPNRGKIFRKPKRSASNRGFIND